MTATYDLTTNVGKIRLNTFGDDTDNPIFQDEEIQAFFNQEGSIRLAAARLLEVVASREAYILKVATNLGLSTDGARLAAEFRAQAKELRAQEKELTTTEDTDPGFEIAEWIVDNFTARQRLHKRR